MAVQETSTRLQKVIARAGIASRRQAEELIKQGLVTVNGQTVLTLGTKIDPVHDHVKVKGRRLKTQAPDMFLLLNKPSGYLSTLMDPEGRPTVKQLLPKPSLRLFPVGRLDFDSEGLLLLTNNGDVAQACLHPSHHVPKTYLVKIKGKLEDRDIRELQKGIPLDDGMTGPARVKKAGKAEANSWIEITIHEGKKHQVKRMFEFLGHPVIRLKRIQFGPLRLGNLLPGQSRFATDTEANELRQLLTPPINPRKPSQTPLDTNPSLNTTGRRTPKPRQ